MCRCMYCLKYVARWSSGTGNLMLWRRTVSEDSHTPSGTRRIGGVGVGLQYKMANAVLQHPRGPGLNAGQEARRTHGTPCIPTPRLSFELRREGVSAKFRSVFPSRISLGLGVTLGTRLPRTANRVFQDCLHRVPRYWGLPAPRTA